MYLKRVFKMFIQTSQAGTIIFKQVEEYRNLHRMTSILKKQEKGYSYSAAHLISNIIEFFIALKLLLAILSYQVNLHFLVML